MNPRSLGLALAALAVGVAGISAGAAASGALRVVDEAGRPVVGATVRLDRVPVSEDPVELARTQVAAHVTAEDGSIDVPLPRVAELVLTVDHPLFAPRILAGDADSFGAVRLERGRSWPGRVRGADGSTVAHGRICVRFELEVPQLLRELGFERCAPIDEGRFEIGGLPEGVSVEARVEAPGFLPLALSDAPAEKQELVLEPGFRIAGQVVAVGGGGLAGAEVWASGGESAESGAGGDFAVRAPRLPAKVRFRAPGHREKTVEVEEIEPEKPLVVALAPGPTLSARVLGSDGRRPEEVVARVLRYQPETADWRTAARVALGEPSRQAPQPPGSGEDAGEEAAPLELEVDLPGGGEYRLVLEAPGRGRHRQPTFFVDPAEHVDLGLVELPQGSGVALRVVDALSGEPVPGVLAQLSRTGTPGVLQAYEGGIAAETSDAEGRLRVLGDEPGTFELELGHRDHATRLLEIELESGEILDLGTVWLGPGTEVKGRVTDRNGEPRPGMRVTLVGAAAGSVSRVAERTTGADGRFAPAKLGAGDYRVEVRGRKLLLDQTFTVSEEEPEIDLDLTVGGARWRGRIYRGERPVHGGTLLVRSLADTADQRGRVMVTGAGRSPDLLGGSGGTSSTAVGLDGSFELLDVPTGLVLATYVGDDGRQVRERLVLPSEAEVQQDLRLTASELEGVVLDAELGTPLAGARLRLRDPLNTVVADALSGPDGGFRLAGFDLASTYRLEADLEGYRSRLLEDVAVAEGAAPLQVSLEPSFSSALHVRLERSDGSRPARATISLFSEGGWMLRSLLLDLYGEIVFDDVAPGRYLLLWHDVATGTGIAAVEVAEEAPAMVSRVLQPGALLVLECGEGCAGAPLPAVAVFGLSGCDITSHLPAISPALRFSPSGRAVLGHLQPGSYLVRSWPDGRLHEERLAVRAGQPALVRLGEPSDGLVGGAP